MSPGRPASRRALTLLELLLAVTILASTMALVASVWAQAGAWTDDAGRFAGAMREHRTIAVMRAQWEDRRAQAAPGERPVFATTDHTTLSFVTATTLLFPDWPLALVAYRIEPDPDHTSPDGVPWRLVYRETRLTGADGAPEPTALDGSGEPYWRETVLFDNCRALAWERFGPEEAEDEDRERAAEERDGAEADEAPVQAWHAYGARYDGPVPAVRLVGERDGKEFGCVFVVRPLR